MGDSNNKSGFSGKIGALTAFLTALTGLIAILHQTGLIDVTPPSKAERIAAQQTFANNQNGTLDENSQADKLAKLEEKFESLNAKEKEQKEEALKDRIKKLEENLKEKESRKPAENVSKASLFDLTGSWVDQHTGGIYEIRQTGNTLTIKEISNLYGTPIVTAGGSGTISGNRISINYNTIYSTAGTLNLQMLENGQILTGSGKDQISGTPISLYLMRNR